MAGKVRVNGTNYSITGGKCRVNGTNYAIKKGRALVGGTGYEINFATPVTLTVTVSVFNQNLNNARVEVYDNGDHIGTVWATALNDGVTVREFTVNTGDVITFGGDYWYLEMWDDAAFSDVIYTDESFKGTIVASGYVNFYVI